VFAYKYSEQDDEHVFSEKIGDMDRNVSAIPLSQPVNQKWIE
jgi:hypothetical protein